MRSDADVPPPGATLSLWSFRDDVAIETAEDGSLTILARWGDVTLDPPGRAIEEVLHRMTFGPVALGNVDGLDEEELHGLFDRLPGRIVRSLGSRDSAIPLLSAQPVSPHGVLELPDVPPDHPVRLSRFALARQRDGELVQESPLSHHRVVLHRPQPSAVIAALARPTTVAEVARRVGLPVALVGEIVAYLIGAGMVVVAENGTFGEDHDPALRSWSPYELMFHSRSRLGRHDEPAGATFRHVDKTPPPPAAKPAPPGRRFPLPRPTDTPTDITLVEAIEARRSTRAFAAESPTAARLGELLHHAAAVRSRQEVDGPGGTRYEVTRRPYPGAGSLYELELYLTADRCPDLPRGIYHYSATDHALTLVNDDPAAVDEVLDSARVTTGTRRPPPALLTITARMDRMAWVFDGISYATTLKHVGVLQQTLYLVATGLGLAACALAMGDDDTSPAALGLDWPAEVSVAEFAVGFPDSYYDEPYSAVHGM
ncbi:SagB family peptide dehydrogenase [Saccharothrix variisporea]|uniref:SagB family peptide dehydrogenase n=1 Tax=Saccharothrix variisporea TaxID=543527 RepID=UPI0011C3E6D1|nr:SagB family peptide dehydrogenase [Saccharothrix variisporea]